MKYHRLMILVLVGLAMVSGFTYAEEASSTQYMEISSHYEAIRMALLTDSMDGVMDHAKALEEKASSLRQNITPDQAGVSVPDLKDSEVTLGVIENTVVAYCPMAQKAWIQPAGEIGNPYMGQEMATCGEVVGES